MVARRYRPVLHVRIVDDLTGAELADVDAASTADGLAYYLRSRHVDDAATESGIAAQVAASGRYSRPPAVGETIAHERRHPISGALELALVAEAH